MPAKLLQSLSDSLRLYGPEPSMPLSPWESPIKNTGVGSHALLQGLFLTQGSNPHLLYLMHCLAGSLLRHLDMGRVAAVSCSPVSISLMPSVSWSGVKSCGKERYQASYKINYDLGVKGIYTCEVGW